jgi:hypothetical protein
VKSVREPDVVAALGRRRDLLHGNVGVAAPVLEAESRSEPIVKALPTASGR